MLPAALHIKLNGLRSVDILLCCRCHQGAIIDLLVTPDGNFLFSSCCQGSLVQYSCSNSQCHVLRVAGQAPPTTQAGPKMLASLCSDTQVPHGVKSLALYSDL